MGEDLKKYCSQIINWPYYIVSFFLILVIFAFIIKNIILNYENIFNILFSWLNSLAIIISIIMIIIAIILLNIKPIYYIILNNNYVYAFFKDNVFSLALPFHILGSFLRYISSGCRPPVLRLIIIAASAWLLFGLGWLQPLDPLHLENLTGNLTATSLLASNTMVDDMEKFVNYSLFNQTFQKDVIFKNAFIEKNIFVKCFNNTTFFDRVIIENSSNLQRLFINETISEKFFAASSRKGFMENMSDNVTMLSAISENATLRTHIADAVYGNYTLTDEICSGKPQLKMCSESGRKEAFVAALSDKSNFLALITIMNESIGNNSRNFQPILQDKSVLKILLKNSEIVKFFSNDPQFKEIIKEIQKNVTDIIGGDSSLREDLFANISRNRELKTSLISTVFFDEKLKEDLLATISSNKNLTAMIFDEKGLDIQPWHKVFTLFWIYWPQLLFIWLLFEIGIWGRRSRNKLVIEEFSDETKVSADNKPVMAKGLASILVVHLERLAKLYRIVDEDRAISTIAEADEMPLEIGIKTDMLDMPQQVLDENSKITLGPVSVSGKLINSLLSIVFNNKKICGSIHNIDGQKDSIFITARMSGVKEAQSWRVDDPKPVLESEGMQSAAPGISKRTQDDMVMELAYRIFLALSIKEYSLVAWKATYYFTQALRSYRDSLHSESDRVLKLLEAEKNLLRAISEDEDYRWAYYNLGVVYTELDLVNAAESSFIKCIKLAPNQWNAYYALSYNYFKRGLFEQAIVQCDEAIKKNPDHLNQAKIYNLKGLAKKEITEAKKENDNEMHECLKIAVLEAFRGLVLAEFRGYGVEQAKMIIDRCKKDLKDEYMFSWGEIPGKDNGRLVKILIQRFDINWIGAAKIEKIDNDKTIKLSTEQRSLSLKLNDKKCEVILERDAGRPDKLKAKWENSKLNIYKDDSPKHSPEEQKAIQQSTEDLEGRVRDEPLNSEARSKLAEHYRDKKNFQLAQKELELALLLKPDDARTHFSLAINCIKLSYREKNKELHLEKASKYLNDALNLFTTLEDRSKTHYWLGRLSLMRFDYWAAISHLSIAKSFTEEFDSKNDSSLLISNSLLISYYLGQAYLKNNNYLECRKEFKGLVNRDPAPENTVYIGRDLGGDDCRIGKIVASAYMGLTSLCLKGDMNYLEALKNLDSAYKCYKFIDEKSTRATLEGLLGFTLFKISMYTGIDLKKIEIEKGTIEEAFLENAEITKAELLGNSHIANISFKDTKIKWIRIKNCSIACIEYKDATTKELLADFKFDKSINVEHIQLKNITKPLKEPFKLKDAVAKSIYIYDAKIEKATVNKKNSLQKIPETSGAKIVELNCDEEYIEYAKLGEAKLINARINGGEIDGMFILENCNIISLDIPIRLMEHAVCISPDAEKYLHLALAWECKLSGEPHDDRKKKTIQERIMTDLQRASELGADKQQDKQIEEIRKRIAGSQPKEKEVEKERASAATDIARNIEGNATEKPNPTQKARENIESKKPEPSAKVQQK